VSASPIILSDKLFDQVKHIGEILGLSPSQCAEYLILSCLQGYAGDGLTLRLCDLAEMLSYKSLEEAQGAAERLEAEALTNHLELGEREPMINVEVIGAGPWNLKVTFLRGEWQSLAT
jgi:hypothetical protein